MFSFPVFLECYKKVDKTDKTEVEIFQHDATLCYTSRAIDMFLSNEDIAVLRDWRAQSSALHPTLS